MSGDNLYGAQRLKFYSEEMTETKKIVLTHFEKKLFHETNSIIYLQRKHPDIKAPETAWTVTEAA